MTRAGGFAFSPDSLNPALRCCSLGCLQLFSTADEQVSALGLATRNSLEPLKCKLAPLAAGVALGTVMEEGHSRVIHTRLSVA